MARDSYSRTSRAGEQSRRHRKAMLAVAAMAGETAWLDGLVRWRDGRLAWEHARGLKSPSPADLALAQRRLNQVGGYPRAAERALGDVAAWLERRQAGLEVAKWLRPLPVAELPALAEQARRDDPRALDALVRLLAAEALCVDPLPRSPSHLLLSRGAAAEAPLEAFIADDTAPPAGRALGALTLGAIRARSAIAEPPRLEPAWLSRGGWPRRAYFWGCRSGLPAEPGLIVALLADEDGSALARRCLGALATPSPFRIETPLLRELLARGLRPERVVAAAEAAIAIRPLADRLDSGAVDAVGSLIERYVRQTGQPIVVEHVARLCHDLLDLAGPSEQLIGPLVAALHRAADLPSDLLLTWLEILVEKRSQVWNVAQSGESDQTAAVDWLAAQIAPSAGRLCSLLTLTRDPRLVRRAIELGCVEELTNHGDRSPEFFRAALGLAREAGLETEPGAVDSLCHLLRAYPRLEAARAAIRPLAQALRPGPLDVGKQLLFSTACELTWERHVIADGLPRIVRHVPRVIAFSDDLGDDWCGSCVACPLIAATYLLDRADPAHAGEWLDLALAELVTRVRHDCDQVYRFQSGAVAAATLAAGDTDRFRVILRACLDHDLRDAPLVERVLPVLVRYRPLAAALATLFPEQPRRCVELLTRLGLAARLGPPALAALSQFEADRPTANGPSVPPEWRSLLALAPELEASAAAYLQARCLLGADVGLPPGVERVLAQPRTLATELVYLERLVEQLPDRRDLAVRVNNLRARLAESERVQHEVRQEAAERLAHLAAAEQLAAAERLVEACYRARLERATGLPVDRPMDDDMMNAALLTVDLDKNRRLLVRLLRAELAGDRRWREQLPANAAFLRHLAERGGDVGAWLAAHPRTYACPEVAGGRVRLRLESEPIRILQMGNYFDTCLSFGGINAFSTVANASDLNKRVIYATDGRGRVVGRKLIALEQNGSLVGFRTYTSLSSANGNAALREIFRHYCGRFAERSGVPLADQGQVPTLVARDWYDDGVVPWGPETTVSELGPSSSPRHTGGSHPPPAPLPAAAELRHDVPHARSHPIRRPLSDRSGRIRRLRAQGRGYRSDQR